MAASSPAEADGALALDQVLGIDEDRVDPRDRAQQLGRADALVAVGVEDLERLVVELDAAGRTRERDPQLLIELGERHEVCTGAEVRLIESTRADEAESMLDHVLSLGAKVRSTARHYPRCAGSATAPAHGRAAVLSIERDADPWVCHASLGNRRPVRERDENA